MFCCLRRNVEASCHKHFVVISRELQTTPITSDECHQRRSCTWRSNRWQHAIQTDIGRGSRFLPTAPAFEASVRGTHRNITITFGTEKTRIETILLDGRNFCRYVCSFRQNTRTWQTPRRTDGRTDKRRHRPRLCIVSLVALGGRIPAVYDQRYKCHNLRDGGRVPPATKRDYAFY